MPDFKFWRPESAREIARDGGERYAGINRQPGSRELARAYAEARRAGRWRFDART